MVLEPVNWNVVVVGHWNRAILTPQGIATRLFKKAEDTEFKVEVPADAIGPYKVHLEGLIIRAASSLLSIELEKQSLLLQTKAMSIAREAIECLPETPIIAGGFNFRFRAPVGSEEINQLSKLIHSEVDKRLERTSNRILGRACTWKTSHHAGLLNMEVSIDDEGLLLTYNFHCDLNREEIIAWLRTPSSDAVESIRELSSQILELDEEFVWPE